MDLSRLEQRSESEWSLLDAAVHAPTAMHAEPLEFVVVQDKATLARAIRISQRGTGRRKRGSIATCTLVRSRQRRARSRRDSPALISTSSTTPARWPRVTCSREISQPCGIFSGECSRSWHTRPGSSRATSLWIAVASLTPIASGVGVGSPETRVGARNAAGLSRPDSRVLRR